MADTTPEDPMPKQSIQDDGSQTSSESTDDKPKDGKYNLRKRTLVARLETEHRLSTPKMPKPKCRPPSLSKYRRKSANSRERQRMQEINTAFNTLQTVLPAQCLVVEDISAGSSSLTKITTLRLAVNYIAALRHVLGDDAQPAETADDICTASQSPVGQSEDVCADADHSTQREEPPKGTVGDQDTRTIGSEEDRLGIGDQTVPTFLPNNKCDKNSNENIACKEVQHNERIPEPDANNNIVDDVNKNSLELFKCRDYIEYLQQGLLEYTSGHPPLGEADNFNVCGNNVPVCDNNNGSSELPNVCTLPVLIAGRLRPPPAYPYP